MDQTELSAILPIVKSCSVKPTVASPSCNVKTAATECYPRLSCNVKTAATECYPRLPCNVKTAATECYPRLSCNVKTAATECYPRLPCNVKTAATECYPRLSCSLKTAVIWWLWKSCSVNSALAISVVHGRVEHEKLKFYLNSEYNFIYSMQRAFGPGSVAESHHSVLLKLLSWSISYFFYEGRAW